MVNCVGELCEKFRTGSQRIAKSFTVKCKRQIPLQIQDNYADVGFIQQKANTQTTVNDSNTYCYGIQLPYIHNLLLM